MDRLLIVFLILFIAISALGAWKRLRGKARRKEPITPGDVVMGSVFGGWFLISSREPATFGGDGGGFDSGDAGGGGP